MTLQRVLVVEGFLDRAFVAGFLKRSHCKPLGAPGNPPPKDPWGAKVTAGQYAYATSSGVFVRVVPSGGSGVTTIVEIFARDAVTRPVDRLLALFDPDVAANADWQGPLESKVRTLATKCSGELLQQNPRAFRSPGVSLAEVGAWVCDDPDPRLPQKQTLERLVVSAIASARPGWFEHVAEFLRTRPDPSGSRGKEEAMGLMAGWFSWRLSEGFYEAVWEDQAIATALERLLSNCGLLRSLSEFAK